MIEQEVKDMFEIAHNVIKLTAERDAAMKAGERMEKAIMLATNALGDIALDPKTDSTVVHKVRDTILSMQEALGGS